MVILASAVLCGWLGGLLLAGAAAGPSVGDQKPRETAVGRVRPVDPKAATLLAAGIARSETFRLVVEGIDNSNVVVYVETGQSNHPGELQLLTATAACRYLRISVRVPGLDNDLLPWLAHELWHALEIARAPEVTDRGALTRFYSRVGRSTRAGGGVELETVEAQRTQARVLDELRRGPAAGGALASAIAPRRGGVR